jgi:hypothetical protein
VKALKTSECGFPPGGAQKDFRIWWTRFLAYGSVYRFAQALTETDESDLPSSNDEVLDETNAVGKRKALAKRRNNATTLLWRTSQWHLHQKDSWDWYTNRNLKSGQQENQV